MYKINEAIFKAYDIRGQYPSEIDEEAVKKIANAYAVFLQLDQARPLKIALGQDVRTSSPLLKEAVTRGLTEAGVDVLDIGIVPTEGLYFAVGFYNLDGGIQVSASHNPAQYNGLKIIREEAQAISADNGLVRIKEIALHSYYQHRKIGEIEHKGIKDDYFAFIRKIVGSLPQLKLKIVANNNFGLSGIWAQEFLKKMKADQFQLIGVNFQADGTFPKGRPDPLIPENRQQTSEEIIKNQADLGVAWDADGDRCYLADEKGDFIEGCHLTALLAEYLLKSNPGEKIIYEPRNIWAVEETVTASGGKPILNKAGHTFIKNRMRQENALFAGEMSGHFYWRDFFYADNGLLPFLMFLKIMADRNAPVSKIIEHWRKRYFVSGEHNYRIKNKKAAIKSVEDHYATGKKDWTDGLSISFDNWRFNLRSSNTEDLLRLNVEAKSAELCQQKFEELANFLNSLASPSPIKL